jgi:mannose-6-phosphate isomerase
LAFDAVPGAAQLWRDQAQELRQLAATKLADRTTGAIHEFFDREWVPTVDAQGGWIEPGHQFEWAWLLWQWCDRTGDADADAQARHLYSVGTEHGRNAAGQIINAIDVRHQPRDTGLRLWPQTERLKACLALAQRSKGECRAQALTAAIEALDTLDSYFATPIAGLWYDRLTPSGSPVEDDAPASSLYHIVCALEYAERYVANQIEYAGNDV